MKSNQRGYEIGVGVYQVFGDRYMYALVASTQADVRKAMRRASK